MQGKQMVAVGVLLGAIASHGVAFEQALGIQGLIDPDAQPAYSITIDGKVWVDGVSGQVVGEFPIEYWSCPYVALAIDVKVESPQRPGRMLPIGSVDGLAAALRALGVRFLIGTFDHRIYWFAIDVENDVEQLQKVPGLLRRHSMIFFRPEDDSEVGRVFGEPYKGDGLPYRPDLA